ncbi:MAG TPA: PAS domain S-box protein [Kofleriaceae bacterium]|jgi:PAS domain S-box-containing protein
MTLAEFLVPFRALVDTTPDGIVVCDQRGTLLLVNAEAERMFGYDHDELLGQSIDILVPDSARPHHQRYTSAYTAAPKVRLIGAYLRELHGRRKDGSEFPVEISLSPYESDRGLLVIGGVRDISERKQLEAEIVRARQIAEAASAAKSEFLSSMSHELRTPLNAVLGFAQLLGEDPDRPLDARQRERLGHVLRGGEHLLRLIDDVLDFSRIEDGRISIVPTAVDIGEVIEAVARTLEPIAARAAIAIRVTPPVALPSVTADRTRLLQILMNFGSNAIKYGRPNGHVTLAAALVGGAVRVSVADDGIGIAPENRAKVFEPFQRAGQETGPIEGTGIGLTISRRLAALMAATIDFTSDGRGSTFWIDLPARRAQVESPVAPAFELARSRLASGPQRYRVLYIEDNPSSTAFMRELVEHLPSIELVTAPSAELGLELVRSRRPGLVLMDINLPGMSGYAATEQLRRDAETSAIPIVGLSAAALAEHVDRAREAGFDRYLTKPVKLEELARALEELLG